MDLTNLLIWIIVGGIGGLLASFFVRLPMGGLIGTIIVGIIGGLIAGWVADLLGLDFQVSGLNLGSIIVAFVGALLLSVIVGAVMRRGTQV